MQDTAICGEIVQPKAPVSAHFRVIFAPICGNLGENRVILKLQAEKNTNAA